MICYLLICAYMIIALILESSAGPGPALRPSSCAPSSWRWGGGCQAAMMMRKSLLIIMWHPLDLSAQTMQVHSCATPDCLYCLNPDFLYCHF